MFRIQVRPVSGHDLALRQRSPIRQSSSVHKLDAIHYLSSILFGCHSTGIGASIMVGFISIALSGCGGLVLNGSTGDPATSKSKSSKSPTLSKVSCGTQTLTGAQTQACSVYLSSSAPESVVVSLSSNNPAVTVPATVTISTGAPSAGFSAVSSNVSQPQTVTLKAASAGDSTTAVIQVNPASASSSLSKISCGTQSLTGPQTKSCSVYLDSGATAPVLVSLSSNSPALTVPSAVTVSAGAASAGFSAVSSNVISPQNVTLTATAAGFSATTVMQLYPAPVPSTSNLSISCGTQSLTGPTTKGCSVYLSGAATSATLVTLRSSSSDLAVPGTVTVAAGATSAGFSATASAVKTPETVTLTASSGGASVTYPIQLNSSSASSPPSSTQHVVDLSWNPPSSSNSVAGYRIYRSTEGTSNFQLLNSSINTQTDYSDSTVASGENYDYEVKSVSSTGQESAPSNITTVTIP